MSTYGGDKRRYAQHMGGKVLEENSLGFGIRLSINEDNTLSTNDPLAGGESVGLDPGSSLHSAKGLPSARHRRGGTTTKYQFMKLATTDMASIERKLDSIKLTDLQHVSVGDSADKQSWEKAAASRVLKFSSARRNAKKN